MGEGGEKMADIGGTDWRAALKKPHTGPHLVYKRGGCGEEKNREPEKEQKREKSEEEQDRTFFLE